MISKLKQYNFQKLVYGQNDCNIQFLHVFEPEMHSQILGHYTTEIGGSRVANRLFGHTNIKSFVEASEKYKVQDKNFAGRGDFFIKGKHVAICLGDKTLALVGDIFRPVPTALFIRDAKQTLYSKVV